MNDDATTVHTTMLARRWVGRRRRQPPPLRNPPRRSGGRSRFLLILFYLFPLLLMLVILHNFVQLQLSYASSTVFGSTLNSLGAPTMLIAAILNETFCWKDEEERGNGKPISQQFQQSHPTGLVVTLLYGGADNPHLMPSICHLFPSQLTHFIVPQRLDVLLVVSGTIGVKDVVDCLHLRRSPVHQHDDGDATNGNYHHDNTNGNNNDNEGNKTWHNLDGSFLTTVEYEAMTVLVGRPYRTKIFVASTKLTLPSYLSDDAHGNASSIISSINPPICRSPLEYIRGTSWYTYELLHLGILHEKNYDYWIKLDPDVVFVRPLDFSILQDMQHKGAILGHAGAYPERIADMACSRGLVRAVKIFVQRKEVCCYRSERIRDRDEYYTNVLIGRTSFWQSPKVRQFGRWLSEEYTDGFFRHRWTDQIFWQPAMELFLPPEQPTTSLFWHASPPSLTRRVADYTNLRCYPVANCWMTALSLKDLSSQGSKETTIDLDVCANGGAFVHTKHTQRWVHRWNRHLTPMYPFWEEQLQQAPYIETYRHNCRGTRWE